MLIRNVYVYEQNQSHRQLKHVHVTKDGQFEVLNYEQDLSTYQKKVSQHFDAKEKYTIMPGLLDSHVHGYGGEDFADVGINSNALATIMQALGDTGLSYAMATLVSLKLPTLKKALSTIDAYVQEQEKNPTQGAAKIVGVHLEGPFIAKNCKGAHAEDALQASIDIEKFIDIISAAPNVKEWKITLAPDLPGAEQFIKEVKTLENKGISVKVFIGHTNPEDKTSIDRAVEAGAVGFTHLGNA